LNIFVIPSWFPCGSNPLSGSFIQEQARALARSGDFNVVVSAWGHGETNFGGRPLKEFWKPFEAYWKSRERFYRSPEGYWTAFTPALYWSHRLPFGGAARLLEANRRNLQAAIRSLGRVDVIHAHVSYPAGYVASVLSKELDIPYVLTEHMGPFPFSSLMPGGKLLPELETAFVDASQVIAVSPGQAGRIRSFGLPEPVVIPNFVDEDVFVPRKKNSSDPFVFLTVCSIVREKGVVDLLDGIARLGLRPGQAEFRIVGEGRDLAYCQQHAQALGISDLVVWCGRRLRPDIVAMFQDADAFVLPSHYESFGMVYAEAIACAKPVIATRCGGGEYIVNETNGMLVDVGDIAALAAALRRMIDHGDAFSAERIRADFMARFSKRAVLSLLKKVYESAIAGRSA